MNQKMRFGSYDQREGLQVGRHVDLRINDHAAASFDLAEVVDMPIGRDRPKHVRRVHAPQLVRSGHVLDIQLDTSTSAPLSSDFCSALQTRQPSRAPKGNLNRLVQWVGNRNRRTPRIVLA